MHYPLLSEHLELLNLIGSSLVVSKKEMVNALYIPYDNFWLLD